MLLITPVQAVVYQSDKSGSIVQLYTVLTRSLSENTTKRQHSILSLIHRINASMNALWTGIQIIKYETIFDALG
jgi:hypothetical protein